MVPGASLSSPIAGLRPSYRYGVQINNGNVVYDGGGPITLQGRVAPNGAVRVIVSAGSQ